MEERAMHPPNSAADNTPPYHLRLQILPPQPITNRPLETYIIQIPKDQIYRIPPPENALIVEHHRKKPKEKSKPTCPLPKILKWIAFTLLLIGVVIGIGFLAIYVSNNPKAPTFSVSNVTVKKPSGGGTTYDVKLKVRNTDTEMGVVYGADEDAWFHYGKRMVALGTFREMSQEKGESTVVHVTMAAVGSAPAAVSWSLADKKMKHKVGLVLEMSSPAKFNVRGLSLWKRTIDLKCDVKVAGGEVLSEDCRTKMS